MKEIKFRGKILKGAWIYGDLLTHTPPRIVCDETWEAIPVLTETVGQYVGLKDTNGKDIYEGDIIRGMKWISAVVFSSGAFGLKSLDLLNDEEYCQGFSFDYLLKERGLSLGKMKIIGNLYDNSELLEG